MSSKKLRLDQYFTSPEIAEHCFKKTLEVIGEENISEFIESSAGECVFLDMIEKYTPDIPYKAYDIDVKDERVVEQDFLKLGMDYKPNRLTGFNFPYGVKNTLSVQFYKKSIQLGDYIASILPISQFNNNMQMYEFDMIYSEDLGKQLYSGREVWCCFNVYKRNYKGLNDKPNYKLKDVEIKEIRSNLKLKPIKLQQLINSGYVWDIRLLAWGTATNNRGVGCILTDDDKLYAKEFYIKINNIKYKQKIIKIFENTNWEKEYNMTATPNLLQWQVYKYLKEMIPELE